MTTRAAVEEFLAQPALAVVGVSRTGSKFGNAAFRDLKAKGYRVFPIHPNAATLEGEPCYRSLKELPEPVGGVLIVVPPAAAEQVVRDAAEAGIKRVWLQQGAESLEAIRFCQDHDLTVVSGECILMFAEPAGWFHRAHRWAWGAVGRLPK